MKIDKNTLEKIMASFPKVPPENGGILGSKNGIVCEYIHDKNIRLDDKAIYIPNILFLNESIEKWETESIEFAGLLHSHMNKEKFLSFGDIEYIKQIMKSLPDTVKKVFFPIVIPKCCIIGYVAEKIGEEIVITNDKIEIVSI